MASVREHLREGHLKSAEHFVKRAKFHKAMAGHFGQLAEMAKTQSDMEDSHDVCKAVADEHLAMRDECADQAQYHNDCAKELSASMKAMGDGRDEIVPTHVSVVTPNIRAIPRFGHQPAERPSVPIEFSHLVKISDDE